MLSMLKTNNQLTAAKYITLNAQTKVLKTMKWQNGIQIRFARRFDTQTLLNTRENYRKFSCFDRKITCSVVHAFIFKNFFENLRQVEVPASNCNNACLEHFPFRFVFGARHCVSGTLSFITFGKIPLFAFLFYHEKRRQREQSQWEFITVGCYQKGTESGRGKNATESDGNFIFIGRMFQVQLLLLCFQHLRNLFPSESYLCFPMNSHHQIHPSILSQTEQEKIQ